MVDGLLLLLLIDGFIDRRSLSLERYGIYFSYRPSTTTTTSTMAVMVSWSMVTELYYYLYYYLLSMVVPHRATTYQHPESLVNIRRADRLWRNRQ